MKNGNAGSGRSRASDSLPPEAWEPLLRLARLASTPVERFFRIEAASGVVLFAAAAIAIVWANSPWAASYFALWSAPVGLHLGELVWERPLAWFVNDGLMTVFFFVAGMEIRRELHHGELSERVEALRRIDVLCREAISPAEGLIERLHPWVAFGIMPIFALANAGIALGGIALEPASTAVAIGMGADSFSGSRSES